jgi:hypothetical protein
MVDLKLDLVTGDVDVSNGLQIVRGVDLYKQKLKLGLGLNLGEWFIDVTAGLPYLAINDPSIPKDTRYFLGDKDPYQEEYIKLTLDEYITEYSFVDSVESEIEVNDPKRVFNYKYTCTLIDGNTITDSINGTY